MARITAAELAALQDELETRRLQDEQRLADRAWQHTTDDRALACPFCGSRPEITPWHGGSATKMMISCEHEDCPLQPSTTGETTLEALEKWNTRATS